MRIWENPKIGQKLSIYSKNCPSIRPRPISGDITLGLSVFICLNNPLRLDLVSIMFSCRFMDKVFGLWIRFSFITSENIFITSWNFGHVHIWSSFIIASVFISGHVHLGCKNSLFECTYRWSRPFVCTYRWSRPISIQNGLKTGGHGWSWSIFKSRLSTFEVNFL